jgi:hypothetical protein
MPHPILQEPFARTLLQHYRDIQSLEGDGRVALMLSAARAVAKQDRQVPEEEKTKLLAAYEAIEQELLPAKTG